ncbi:MAG: ABC transporter permease subunit [Proteobacteria bacterium]|nr:ABC transporter permease subunit [Pseudomonadota bacterium]
MLRYLAYRLLLSIPLLIGITLVSFTVIQLAPGEPLMMESALNPNVSAESIEKLRAHFNLDKPVYIQYWLWLKDIAVLDFGTSFNPDGRPVLDKITERLPVTLWMNVIGLLLVLALAIPLGVQAARKPHSLFDRSTTVLVFTAFAAPSFWIGLLCLMFFGVTLEWVPTSGLSSYGAESWPLWQRLLDWGHHLLLPIAVGTLGAVAGMSRYMRTSMLEQINQDYITTARAKGVPEHDVFYHHGLRNALLPVITILGLSIPGLIGGSVIIESLFSIPGMGKLFFEGVMQRDYPLIMGVLTIGAVLTLLGNMLADVAYALADPRMRYNNTDD